MITYTGKEYLQIDIASHFGLDKELFETRIAWVHEHENELEDLLDEADNYYRYAAAIMAYREAQQGQPSGYMVGLDACASGPQILSAMIGCEIGASNTGATGTTRKDVYGIQTTTMEQILDDNVDITRKEAKDAFMPHFYNSTAEPKRIFGKGTDELAAFYQACGEVCPGANNLLGIIDKFWDPNALSYSWIMPDCFTAKCLVKETVEDKIFVDVFEKELTFTYRHDVNQAKEEGLFLQANITHSVDGYFVREVTARANHNKPQLNSVIGHLVDRLKRDIVVHPASYLLCETAWRHTEILSIEGVEFVNSWSVNQMSEEYCTALLALVRSVIRNPSYQLTTIHDEYKNLPNYMNYTRAYYIDMLAELADGNLLNSILSDIAGRPVKILKMSSNLSSLIRKAEYPLA